MSRIERDNWYSVCFTCPGRVWQPSQGRWEIGKYVCDPERVNNRSLSGKRRRIPNRCPDGHGSGNADNDTYRKVRGLLKG